MKINRFDVIDSTNTFLKTKNELENYEVAIAKIQTAGRGRRGNTWKSMEGAALFSFALKEDRFLPMEEYRKLPLIVGLSVLRGLKKFHVGDYKFKWTNDIYIENKKISGILVEKVEDFFIIGIGINVNNSQFEEISHKATSLTDITKRVFDSEEIALSIINEFKRTYLEFMQGNWKLLLNEINENNYLLNKDIDIDLRTRIDKGVAKNINEDGTLQVVVDGQLKSYDIGEVHISFENK